MNWMVKSLEWPALAQRQALAEHAALGYPDPEQHSLPCFCEGPFRLR